MPSKLQVAIDRDASRCIVAGRIHCETYQVTINIMRCSNLVDSQLLYQHKHIKLISSRVIIHVDRRVRESERGISRSAEVH